MLDELNVLCGYAGDQGWRKTLPAEIAVEFPSIFVSMTHDAGRVPHVAASEWARSDFDTWSFDCRVDDLARERFALRISLDHEEHRAFPLEVLNRCQRLIDRRNRHSQSSAFQRVLRIHEGLHDRSKPLVRADYNHSLDMWHWMLRLDPDVSLASQIAALLHDLERQIARAVMSSARVHEDVQDRVLNLIAGHERTSEDAETALLNDADALSFFSLDSGAYADSFGPREAKKKVESSWRRMSSAARAKLAGVRLRRDVREMLDDVAGDE